MKYWQRIQINNLAQIQQSTEQYLQRHDILNKSRRNPGFYLLPKMQQEVPELTTMLSTHKFLEAAVYIMWDNTAGLAHRDSTRTRARINIPIRNCDNTVTEFWHCVNEQHSISPAVQGNGLPYRSYEQNQILLRSSVCINEPTLIRVQEIHSVRLLAPSAVPRITLTCKFYPDVVELFEDSD